MPADPQEVVSVVVTTRNSGQMLGACLASIRGQTYTAVELIVVDNHSSDDTLTVAARYADQVVTIGPERSAQRNHGASLTTGAALLFVDADMVLDPGVVAEGISLLHSSGLPAVMIPEETIGVGFWTACRALERGCYTGDDTIEAARLYTRSAFVAAGGFDTDLNGGEDWDLSRRVAQRRRLPRTRAMIHHDEGRTRLRAVYTKRRYYAPGYLAFVRKHGRGAMAQGNPIFRAAYVRNWRTLGRHPLLTAGMFTLKAVELAAVLDVAADTKLRGRVRDRSNEVYPVVNEREQRGQAAAGGAKHR
ncbi:MAG: glycosyltransferase [Candidatus Dormiibacterota bacterium]